MRIFVMGQCTLHWGRMEYGNIGNYYIVEPMFGELRKVFPEAEIVTTMQFSDIFCRRHNIITVPQEIYYDFDRTDNLESAKHEYQIVSDRLTAETPYINEIRKSDLVIDFSGDIWGDNASFLGNDRFEAGLYKDLTAQLLKPTVMIAGSPGPFKYCKVLDLAKQAYAGFSLVINREPASSELLGKYKFDLSKTKVCACPSFLFQPASAETVKQTVLCNRLFIDNTKVKVGVMLCGWNFSRGPYDIWPRRDSEYDNFVELICNLAKESDREFYLLAHSNGFEVPPASFRLKHGRDFPIMKQLDCILQKTDIASKVFLLDGIYSPEITKGIIKNFDVLISGRVHGAVGGLSQAVPTMIIDYGHEPKAHKLIGFAKMADIEEYIANPNDVESLIQTGERLIGQKDNVHRKLIERMDYLTASAKNQFRYLQRLCV